MSRFFSGVSSKKFKSFSNYLSSEDFEMSDCRELRFRREESRLSLEPESSLPDSETGSKVDRQLPCCGGQVAGKVG